MFSQWVASRFCLQAHPFSVAAQKWRALGILRTHAVLDEVE